MTSFDILKIASKVFGLYFIVQAISSLRDMFFYLARVFSTGSDHEGVFFFLTSVIYFGIFNLVVAFVLIFRSDWVASKLAPDATWQLSIGLLKKDWIELALIIISGLTILYSLPEILYKLTHYIYFNDYDEADRHLYWTNENKAALFYSLFKLLFGLFVLFNARNFGGRLAKIGDKDDKLGG